MARLPANEDPKIVNAKFNPLADYKLQIDAEKKVRKSKSIGETSLADDPRYDLFKLKNDDTFFYKEDMGQLPHGKVMDSAENRDLIIGLNSSTQKLFLWIVFALDFRSDIVELNYDVMANLKFKMSPNTFQQSIKDLESNHIIRRIDNTPKAPDYWKFFINPQIIWKGNAVRFFKEVIQVHPDYGKVPYKKNNK